GHDPQSRTRRTARFALPVSDPSLPISPKSIRRLNQRSAIKTTGVFQQNTPRAVIKEMSGFGGDQLNPPPKLEVRPIPASLQLCAASGPTPPMFELQPDLEAR
ncbi:MAG: hypothetical protein ABJL55_18130, partial [Roseibium sp.]